MKELNGGFISFRDQDVYFLNPSVRDYVATVFSSSRDFVTDVADSAIRIKQLSSLYSLGVTKYPQVNEWVLDDPDELANRIRPMLSVEYYRFHSGSSGLRAERFELSIREQVEFIVQLSESTKHAAFVTLLAEAIAVAADYWERRSSPDLAYAVAMLNMISEADWLMKHGGAGQAAILERIVIDGLPEASAEEWLAILDYQSDLVLATQVAKAAVDSGFRSYLSHGLAEEMHRCTDASDYSSLAENLELIESRHEIDLSEQIKQLEERAAEREDEEARDGVGSTSVPISASAPATPTATDEQLSQMFRSLI